VPLIASASSFLTTPLCYGTLASVRFTSKNNPGARLIIEIAEGRDKINANLSDDDDDGDGSPGIKNRDKDETCSERSMGDDEFGPNRRSAIRMIAEQVFSLLLSHFGGIFVD
jgi:hypothetical protein